MFAPELSYELEGDVLIHSLGRVPDDALALSLQEHGIEYRAAGDCRSPRAIEEAVLEGTLAARELVGAASVENASVSRPARTPPPRARRTGPPAPPRRP